MELSAKRPKIKRKTLALNSFKANAFAFNVLAHQKMTEKMSLSDLRLYERTDLLTFSLFMMMMMMVVYF